VAWPRYSVSAKAKKSVVASSALYETEPVGFSGQPHFLNQVIEIATSFPPPALLEFLLQSERKLGRIRQQRWGPRNIDLDLLAFQQIEVQSGHLILPHPEIARRRFVLAPWCEIAPDFVVPRWNLAVKELLARCADHSGVIMHKQA
jgi:2-amino-4-hydroxy-6-hydroxymethyldihydropteridine diphosphokinase